MCRGLEQLQIRELVERFRFYEGHCASLERAHAAMADSLDQPKHVVEGLALELYTAPAVGTDMTAGSPSNDVDDGVECAHALATRTILDTALELTAIVARDIMQLTRLMAQLTCAMLDLIKTTETVSTTVAAHAVGFFCNAPPHELQILSQMRNARLRANA